MKRQPRTVTKEQIQMDVEDSKGSRGVRTIPGIGYHAESTYEPKELLMDLPF